MKGQTEVHDFSPSQRKMPKTTWVFHISWMSPSAPGWIPALVWNQNCVLKKSYNFDIKPKIFMWETALTTEKLKTLLRCKVKIQSRSFSLLAEGCSYSTLLNRAGAHRRSSGQMGLSYRCWANLLQLHSSPGSILTKPLCSYFHSSLRGDITKLYQKRTKVKEGQNTTPG